MQSRHSARAAAALGNGGRLVAAIAAQWGDSSSLLASLSTVRSPKLKRRVGRSANAMTESKGCASDERGDALALFQRNGIDKDDKIKSPLKIFLQFRPR